MSQRKFSRQYIINVIAQALRQGTSPRQLALTCALGVVIGIFPVLGVTTLICLGLSLLFRLNVVVIQLVNYLAFPLQMVLIFPFIKAGTYIFGLNAFTYTPEEFISTWKKDYWLLIKEAGLAIATGVGVWTFVSIPLFFVLFYSCLFLFKRWNKEPFTGN